MRRSLLVRAVFVLFWVGVAAVALVAVVGGGPRSAGVTDASRFDLPALNGSGRVRLAAFAGRPVVVDLFASWCTACRTELPAMARVAAGLRGRVSFIGVDSSDTGDGAAMAKQYQLAESGFVLARDINGASRSGLHDSLGAPGMPATAFYNASGKRVFTAIEAMTDVQLRDLLQRLYSVAA